MKTISICLVLTLISLLGCRRDKIEPTAFDKDSYPLNVGNWWRYKVTNLRAQTTDTLLLKMDAKIIQNNVVTYKCHLEQEKTKNILDSAQVVLSNTELSYKSLDGNSAFFGDFKLKLPFHTGDKWDGYSDVDAFKVASFTANDEVLGKKYNIYDIQRSFPGFNWGIGQTMQISKGIGIVSQHIQFFDSAQIHEYQFELVDYKLN
jgi:hypothetical protein